MSFKRSVQRDKKNEITHQPIKDVNDFKSNFNFTWIPFNSKTLIILVVIFIISQFICVPLLAQFCTYGLSLILTYGLLSSLLIVLSFWLINKDKVKVPALLTRYCFCALILGCFMWALVQLMGI